MKLALVLLLIACCGRALAETELTLQTDPNSALKLSSPERYSLQFKADLEAVEAKIAALGGSISGYREAALTEINGRGLIIFFRFPEVSPENETKRDALRQLPSVESVSSNLLNHLYYNGTDLGAGPLSDRQIYRLNEKSGFSPYALEICGAPRSGQIAVTYLAPLPGEAPPHTSDPIAALKAKHRAEVIWSQKDSATHETTEILQIGDAWTNAYLAAAVEFHRDASVKLALPEIDALWLSVSSQAGADEPPQFIEIFPFPNPCSNPGLTCPPPPAPPPAPFSIASSRVFVGEGEAVAIAGLSIPEGNTRRVVIRVRGPSLASEAFPTPSKASLPAMACSASIPSTPSGSAACLRATTASWRMPKAEPPA